MGGLLPEILAKWVDDYQIFNQGFFCYFKRDYLEAFREGSYDDA